MEVLGDYWRGEFEGVEDADFCGAGDLDRGEAVGLLL